MTDMPRHPLDSSASAPVPGEPFGLPPHIGGADASMAIGTIREIGGSGALVALDLQRLALCNADTDSTISLAGQVGTPLKVKVAGGWLLATVRDQRQDRRPDGASGGILCTVDFLGEGAEEQLTGRIYDFRRGITRYPLPGAAVHPASTADLQQIYACDERPAVRIGTVHPTPNIPAALYTDALLGKHFALLGSTGTGKSTAAALILHRICESAPQGHVVMIDPHGEYAAAFRDTGAIFDVSNLQMPYWLMNFEEH